jgi:hypothetical protein
MDKRKDGGRPRLLRIEVTPIGSPASTIVFEAGDGRDINNGCPNLGGDRRVRNTMEVRQRNAIAEIGDD